MRTRNDRPSMIKRDKTIQFFICGVQSRIAWKIIKRSGLYYRVRVRRTHLIKRFDFLYNRAHLQR